MNHDSKWEDSEGKICQIFVYKDQRGWIVEKCQQRDIKWHFFFTINSTEKAHR